MATPNQALYEAVLSGDVAAARAAHRHFLLLAAQAGAQTLDLHAPFGPHNLTPLMLAAYRGDVPMIKALGKMAPALNALCFSVGSPFDGFSALALAAVAGHAAAVRALLALGCDPNQYIGWEDHEIDDWTGPVTALHAAAGPGYVDPPLHWPPTGSEEAMDEALAALLEARDAYNINVEVEDPRGWSPLFLALHRGRINAANLLLDACARADGRDRYDASAIRKLLENDDPPVGSDAYYARHALVLRLLAMGAPAHHEPIYQSPLFVAAVSNNPDTLLALLDAPGGQEGARAHDDETGSILHFMMSRRRYDFCLPARVALLLGRGADPLARDGRGRLPAHEAAAHGNLRGLRLLLDLERATDPSSADNEGRTLLMACSGEWRQTGQKSCFELLLARGADPLARDQRGRLAAHYAAEAGNLPALQQLLRPDRLPDPSIADNDGNTLVLLCAAHPSCLPALVLLLERGADARQVDSSGASAADLLLKKVSWSKENKKGLLDRTNWPAMHALRMLVRAGAPVNSENFTRLAPLLRDADRHERDAKGRARKEAMWLEETVGLAFDARDAREADEAVAASKRRLKELEEALGCEDEGAEEKEEEEEDDKAGGAEGGNGGRAADADDAKGGADQRGGHDEDKEGGKDG